MKYSKRKTKKIHNLKNKNGMNGGVSPDSPIQGHVSYISDNVCAICDDFNNENSCEVHNASSRSVPHIFHAECMYNWFLAKTISPRQLIDRVTCPLCREDCTKQLLFDCIIDNRILILSTPLRDLTSVLNIIHSYSDEYRNNPANRSIMYSMLSERQPITNLQNNNNSRNLQNNLPIPPLLNNSRHNIYRRYYYPEEYYQPEVVIPDLQNAIVPRNNNIPGLNNRLRSMMDNLGNNINNIMLNLDDYFRLHGLDLGNYIVISTGIIILVEIMRDIMRNFGVFGGYEGSINKKPEEKYYRLRLPINKLEEFYNMLDKHEGFKEYYNKHPDERIVISVYPKKPEKSSKESKKHPKPRLLRTRSKESKKHPKHPKSRLLRPRSKESKKHPKQPKSRLLRPILRTRSTDPKKHPKSKSRSTSRRRSI